MSVSYLAWPSHTMIQVTHRYNRLFFATCTNLSSAFTRCLSFYALVEHARRDPIKTLVYIFMYMQNTSICKAHLYCKVACYIKFSVICSAKETYRKLFCPTAKSVHHRTQYLENGMLNVSAGRKLQHIRSRDVYDCRQLFKGTPSKWNPSYYTY